MPQSRYVHQRQRVVKNMKRMLKVPLWACGLLVAAPGRACAYLDPGSGSMLLQVLLGGLAGIAVLLKMYWHRLLAWLGLEKGQQAETGANELPAQAEAAIDESSGQPR